MPLSALTEAAEARRTAEQNYRTAVLTAAHKHGVALTAETLGVSKQAVRQLVKRASTDTAPERLAELNERYDRVVVYHAGEHTLSDGKATTAYRNGQAKKRERRGLGPLPTLKAEALELAETKVLELLRQGLTVDAGKVTFTPLDLAEIEKLQAVSEDGCPF